MKLISGATIPTGKGVKLIEPRTSSLASAIEADRRKKEEERLAAEQEKQRQLSDSINKAIEEQNAYRERVAKRIEEGNALEKIGALGSLALSNLGLNKKDVLPEISGAPSAYESARQAQLSQQEYQKEWLGRAQNLTHEVLFPAVQEKARTFGEIAKGINAYTYRDQATEEQKFAAREAGVGALKSIGELASGTAKLATEFSPVSGFSGLRKVAGFIGGKPVEQYIDRNTPEYVKAVDATIDNNGILNYKPEYSNEYQKTGGEIAEIGSWFIPITRTAKVAEAEKVIGKAISEIPKVAEIIGANPKGINVVKSGGKFFYEVAKDAADVAALDIVRGKDWNDIKSDVSAAAVGGAVIRGGLEGLKVASETSKLNKITKSLEESVGKLTDDEIKSITESVKSGNPVDSIASGIIEKRNYEKNLLDNISSVTERFGVVTPEEKSLITSLTKEGKSASAIGNTLAKNRTFVIDVVDNADQVVRGVPKSPTDYDSIAKEIEIAKDKIVEMESVHTLEDIKKRYDYAKDWKKKFKDEFGIPFNRETISTIAKNSLDAGNGRYQEIYDTTIASGKSIRRKIESSAGEGTRVSFVSQAEGEVKVPERAKTRIPSEISEPSGPLVTKEKAVVKTPETTISTGISPEIVQTRRVAKAASDTNKKIAQMGFESLPESELAKYDSTTKKEQIDWISNLLENDYERAKRIATGIEDAPDGVRSQALFESVKSRAENDGDIDLMMKLASSPVAEERSRLASELGASGYLRNPNSVVDNISAIEKSRKEYINNRVGEKKVKDKIISEKKSLSGKIKNAKPTRADWEEFISVITC